MLSCVVIWSPPVKWQTLQTGLHHVCKFSDIRKHGQIRDGLKCIGGKAREKAQWLRALLALPEDPSASPGVGVGGDQKLSSTSNFSISHPTPPLASQVLPSCAHTFFCWDRALLCSPCWLQTPDPPASATGVLRLWACPYKSCPSHCLDL